jgi:hypothetical protein
MMTDRFTRRASPHSSIGMNRELGSSSRRMAALAGRAGPSAGDLDIESPQRMVRARFLGQ